MATSQQNVNIGERRDVAPWLSGITYFPDREVSINFSEYICLVEHQADVFATDLAAGYWLLIGGAGASTPVLITDAGVISAITDASSWDDDGDYTGSTAGMLDGNFYYDDDWNQKYHFDGTTLRRFTYNSLID